ncbi:MAG TPA: hypothetical protein VI756_04810 [Blastocatellia bacterium]
MGLDVRLPIGAMFAAAGLLLAVYGIITNNDPQAYEKSLSIDINLWWGLVMLVFGLIFLLMGIAGRKTHRRGVAGQREEAQKETMAS